MTPKILLSTSQVAPANYVEAITKCGGEPIAAYCPSYKDEYAALLLAGGVDIHPSLYGEPVNGSVNMDTQRDAAELALIKAFLADGKPILGICRGQQLLNVYFGGSLYQHIETADTHTSPLEKEYPAHEAEAIPGSICHGLYGTHFSINSHHHQAIKALAPGLKATVFASGGTIIEAIEHESLPVFAVQWHPEKMCFSAARPDTVDGSGLFRHFLSMLDR